MRALIRITGCALALLPFALVAAAAFGATITSVVNQTEPEPGGRALTGTGGTWNDPPYCAGALLWITGSGFVADGGPVIVSIGGVPAIGVTIASDTTIYAQVAGPPITGTVGTVGSTLNVVNAPVTVTTAKGTFSGGTYPVAPCAAAFTTVSKAVVTGVSPNPARGGGKVTINGSGFVGVTSVTVGGHSAAFAIPSDHNLILIVPKTVAKGKLILKITNPAGTTNGLIGVGVKVATTPAATSPKTSTPKPKTTTTTPGTTTPLETLIGDPTAGAAVFSANCASCHTLAAAHSTATVGPNLDGVKPEQGDVVSTVTNGLNAMPSFNGKLTSTDINNVAAYVYQSTHH